MKKKKKKDENKSLLKTIIFEKSEDCLGGVQNGMRGNFHLMCQPI